MGDPEKTREDRLRRMAKRQGLMLKKVRRRDERAVDFGKYYMTDFNGRILAGIGDHQRAAFDLDDVEEYLTSDK